MFENQAAGTGHTTASLVEWIIGQSRQAKAYGLLGSSKAYVLSEVQRKNPSSLMVVAPTQREAETLREDFRFFCGQDGSAALLYPAWETLPWDPIPPTPDTIAQRLSVLFQLSQGGARICFASARAILQRVMPKERLTGLSIELKQGQEGDRDGLIHRLIEAGYARVDMVEDQGEFALRGGIMDVFSPLYPDPVRLEWFGDEIVSLRCFDPETQRSSKELTETTMIPAQETPASEARFVLGDFLSYLSETDLVVLSSPGLILQEMADFREEVQERFERSKARVVRSLSPGEFCSDPEEMFAGLMDRARLLIEELEITGRSNESCQGFPFRIGENQQIRREILRDPKSERLLEPLIKEVEKQREKGSAVFLVSGSAEQAGRLAEVLEAYGVLTDYLPAPFPSARLRKNDHPVILVGDLSAGFSFPEEGLTLITEEEIFGERRKVRRSKRKDGGPFISSFGDLSPGDAVVHLDYGIGIYRGLYRLDVSGLSNDYLLLEYMGGDKLYVPAHRLNLVQKYIGAGEKKPRLDRLGGTGWKRLTKKVAADVEKMTRELLEIYAARRHFPGFAFSAPDRYYREFEARFEYEETRDQSEAIQDVLTDLERPAPTDRLICGDVGYGKTEVAIRAAFKAVMDAKQVAVLVPTTILAQQHHVTFSKRLEAYPVIIESISRFKTPRQQKQILENLEKGKIDIVIGTHRLLQGDLKFKDLGLLIIDEEHRFGVTHKEKLKKLRKLVDVLSLSATPIPRTLHMSLTGIRDMSVIATPPQDRQSIRTFLSPFSDEVIRSAILQESRRGGQVFFVHNRVHNINAMGDYLRQLVPEVRLAIAHGQMSERDLEKVMLDFIAREIDVLLCTSIIESGLDIPTANTIVINRAEQFGLADLYQLRGRVGRSKEVAYAYLLVPGESALSRDALKRLRAIQEFTELGSGFKLAIQDLEIRGAGNLLGSQQSGHIAAVGFEMYTQLVERAIKRLRGEEIEEEITPEIRWNKPAFIPDTYVENPHQRLSIYKRLSGIQSEEDVEEMRSELHDRYGPIPEPVTHLLEVMRVKPVLSRMRVRAFDFDGRRAVLTFDRGARIEPSRMVDLINRHPDRLRFSPGLKLTVHLKQGENADTLVNGLFEELITSRRESEAPRNTSSLSLA